MTKKQSSELYISITHLLTAGLISYLINLIAVLVVLMPLADKSEVLRQAIAFLLSVFAIWIGVKFASSYLNKAYVINDKQKILIISTVIYAFFILAPLGATIEEAAYKDVIIFLATSLPVIGAFYYFSAKYIKTDEIINK